MHSLVPCRGRRNELKSLSWCTYSFISAFSSFLSFLSFSLSLSLSRFELELFLASRLSDFLLLLLLLFFPLISALRTAEVKVSGDSRFTSNSSSLFLPSSTFSFLCVQGLCQVFFHVNFRLSHSGRMRE